MKTQVQPKLNNDNELVTLDKEGSANSCAVHTSTAGVRSINVTKVVSVSVAAVRVLSVVPKSTLGQGQHTP